MEQQKTIKISRDLEVVVLSTYGDVDANGKVVDVRTEGSVYFPKGVYLENKETIDSVALGRGLSAGRRGEIRPLNKEIKVMTLGELIEVNHCRGVNRSNSEGILQILTSVLGFDLSTMDYVLYMTIRYEGNLYAQTLHLPEEITVTYTGDFDGEELLKKEDSEEAFREEAFREEAFREDVFGEEEVMNEEEARATEEAEARLSDMLDEMEELAGLSGHVVEEESVFEDMLGESVSFEELFGEMFIETTGPGLNNNNNSVDVGEVDIDEGDFGAFGAFGEDEGSKEEESIKEEDKLGVVNKDVLFSVMESIANSDIGNKIEDKNVESKKRLTWQEKLSNVEEKYPEEFKEVVIKEVEDKTLRYTEGYDLVMSQFSDWGGSSSETRVMFSFNLLKLCQWVIENREYSQTVYSSAEEMRDKVVREFRRNGGSNKAFIGMNKSKCWDSYWIEKRRVLE